MNQTPPTNPGRFKVSPAFNGKDIEKLQNRFEFARPADGGQNEFYGLTIQAPGAAVPSRDIAVVVDLDVEAQVFDFSFTYGILDNLDVNLDVPVIRTFLRSRVSGTTPDPRCVALAGQDFEPDGFNCLSQFEEDGQFQSATFGSDRESSLGVGDIRLRTKYNAIRSPLMASGLLDVVIPSGDVEDFQGTGDTRLGTLMIVSKEFRIGDVLTVEAHALGGVEFVVNDVDRSQARYFVGATVQTPSPLSFTVDFIGRSEFARQVRIGNAGRLPAVKNGQYEQTFNELFVDPDPNSFTGQPYFVDVKRNDILDLSLGLKWQVTDQGVLFANFVVPLNDDGIRAEIVPTVGLEYNFGIL